MGNHATKVSDAADNVRKRMTIRRRRPENQSEFTPEEIQKKFECIPLLTAQEKLVLKSSWALIKEREAEVSTETLLRHCSETQY